MPVWCKKKRSQRPLQIELQESDSPIWQWRNQGLAKAVEPLRRIKVGEGKTYLGSTSRVTSELKVDDPFSGCASARSTRVLKRDKGVLLQNSVGVTVSASCWLSVRSSVVVKHGVDVFSIDYGLPLEISVNRIEGGDKRLSLSAAC
jgi:hypothetical protein